MEDLNKIIIWKALKHIPGIVSYAANTNTDKYFQIAMLKDLSSHTKLL